MACFVCRSRRFRRCGFFGMFFFIMALYGVTEFRYHFDRSPHQSGDGAGARASFTFSTSFDLSLSMIDRKAGSGGGRSGKDDSAVLGKDMEVVDADDEEDDETDEELEPQRQPEKPPGSAVLQRQDSGGVDRPAQLAPREDAAEPAPNAVEPARPKRRLTIILHTGAAYYNTRLKSQLDTWLRADQLPKGFDYLIYTTDDVQPGKESVMFRVNNTKKFSTEVEDYIAMNERVLQSFEHALNTHDSDFYIKIDDDTYVNTTLLASLLNDLDANRVPRFLDANPDDNINMYNARVAKQIEKVAKYAQLVTKPGEGRYYGDCSCITHTMKIPIKPPPDIDLAGLSPQQVADRTLKLGRWKYACGGPGYLIDRIGMQKLVAFERQHTCHRILEDITVGLCMDYIGVGCTHVDSFINYERMGSKKQRAMFHVKPQKFLSLIKRSVTIHKVLPANMYAIHKMLTGLE
ncbi:hypothetical protein DFJ74DRAFT_668953 [Hyaloraphidium curvatum]|nr:hypothetical protein DFJ74DRAFT_668953 [Hyaloraphidium curvatum]